MDEQDWLAERFEQRRPRLRAVAYRMLGSLSEADDAVQEAWLRLSRSDADEIENLDAWLTTVVARLSLNMLRSRRTRREEPWGPRMPEPIVDSADGVDPEHEALLADSVGLAMLVVLDLLQRPALINGAAGVVSLKDGKPFSIGAVTVRDGRIAELDFVSDPEVLARLDLTRSTCAKPAPRRPQSAPSGGQGPPSRHQAAVLGLSRRPDRVKAAVDVKDLAGDRARVVGQQEADRARRPAPGPRRPSRAAPASRHSDASCSKPGMPRAATVPSGPAETRLTRIPRGPRSRAR